MEFLKKMARVDEAEAIGESIITRFPENEDLWMDYSDIFILKGNYDKALEILNLGWQRCPQSHDIGYRKVAYLLQSGKIAEGEELLTRMVANDVGGLKELEEYYPEIKNNLLFVELSAKSNNIQN
jgi:tetratricopeptide (TPR) repeat protein